MMNHPAQRLLAAALFSAAVLSYAGPVAAAPPAASASAPEIDATTLARRVADRYARDTAGVIGLRSESELVVSGMGSRRTREHAWFVYVDGAVAESGSSGGDVGAMEARVHQPYQRRYVNEYRYAYAPCVGCATGTVAIAYEATAHDAYHGRGTIVVDSAQARVSRADFAPYIVPRPARSGVVSLLWGAIADAWLPISATGAFSGRVGPFNGSAALRQTFSEYRRYADVASAEKAMGIVPSQAQTSLR